MKKLIKKLKVFLFVFVAFIAATLTVGQANADTLIYDLNFMLTGTSPEGSTPWISATFDDSFGGANDVRLTMSAGNLMLDESIAYWLFNFDPALDPTLLSFSVVGTPGAVPNNINTGADAYKADGDGFYDIEFDFPPSPGNFASRFTTGETVVYDISYSSAIDVSSFNFISAPNGGEGEAFSAAHIQSIGVGEDSGWIAVVPEPISSTLFIVGGATLGFRRFWKKRRKI